MLMSFGIINFMESNMLSAREALLQIQAVLDVSTGNLTNGGIELSEREIDYIIQSICNGLENTDVKN
jgi:hypothetical protein